MIPGLGPPRRYTSSGGELAYVDVGEGEPVVLLHGFPLSSLTWRDLAPSLAQRTRVIVVDLLGYGDSHAPPDAPLDIRAQSGYVRELLGALGVQRYAVVGHADGGGIAQLLGLGGDVDAMVLVAPVAFGAWPVEATRELQVVEPDRLTAELAEAGMRAALLNGAAEPAAIPDEVVRGYLAPWVTPDGPARFVRAARGLDGLGLTGHDDAFGAWTFPVLLLWGEDDPYLPVDLAERLNDAIPSSTLGLLPGVGHLVLDEAGPTIVPMITEWLRVRYLHQPHGHGDPNGGLVMLQLERRSALADLAEYEQDDPPVRYDPNEQEVGPNA